VITLVCGPPCSGKSTYVQQRAKPTDLIVDHDVIAQEFGSPRTHGHTQPYRIAAEQRIEQLLDEVEAGMHRDAWIIRTLPHGQQRRALARRLGADQVVVLTEPRGLLVERALDRSNPRHTISLIDWWLRVHTPDPADDSAVGFFD
jgi:predicted kinase